MHSDSGLISENLSVGDLHLTIVEISIFEDRIDVTISAFPITITYLVTIHSLIRNLVILIPAFKLWLVFIRQWAIHLPCIMHEKIDQIKVLVACDRIANQHDTPRRASGKASSGRLCINRI